MMKREEFDAILADCIADQSLSRGERRALRQVLDERDLGPRELELLRSRAFAAAADEVDQPRAREVIGWLSDVVGLLLPAAPKPAAASATACFAPHDDCPGKVVRLLREARRRVDICVFTITDNRISRAIEQAHRRGARVRILTDDDKSGDLGSDIARLSAKGIPVGVDDSDDHMHHKFAIFDDATLLTGSYNWTRSAAEHNHENFIVTGEPALVASFGEEFSRLWARFA